MIQHVVLIRRQIGGLVSVLSFAGMFLTPWGRSRFEAGEQPLGNEVATEAVGGMSTGATATTTTPPTVVPIPVAQPTMKAVVPKGFR